MHIFTLTALFRKTWFRAFVESPRFVGSDAVGGGIFQLMFVQRPIFNMEILRYFAEYNETTL